MELPGTNELSWCWPREPLEAGGRDRPLYYQTRPGETDVGGILLESFSVGGKLLPEYLDISGGRSGCLRSSVTAGLTETVWSKRPGKPSSSGAPYLDTTNLSDGIQRGFSFQGLVVNYRCGR